MGWFFRIPAALVERGWLRDAGGLPREPQNERDGVDVRVDFVHTGRDVIQHNVEGLRIERLSGRVFDIVYVR